MSAVCVCSRSFREMVRDSSPVLEARLTRRAPRS
jgi:hypothetical protein